MPDSLAAGSLRHRVIIEQRVNPPRRNDLKEEIVEWEEIAAPSVVWANVEALTGREFWQANQAQSAVSHTVTMRYREGITTRHRLRWDGRTLNIESIAQGRTEGSMILRCVEQFEAQPARGY